jgi:hypothetical protein
MPNVGHDAHAIVKCTALPSILSLLEVISLLGKIPPPFKGIFVVSRPRSPDPEPIAVPAKTKAKSKAMIRLRLSDPAAFYDTKSKQWRYPRSDIMEVLRKLQKKFDGQFKMTTAEAKLWGQFVSPK